MPSFAEQQLAKYGWKQGEGLGKDKSGITRAITVSRRTDNRGVGSDSSQWTSNWWDNLYNKAASSTKADDNADEIEQYRAKIEQASTERDTIGDYNGMFVKPSTSSESQSGSSTPMSTVVDRTKLVRDGNVHLGTVISDAELFAACEGRMARKGARAEQSGKLKRVNGDGMPRPEVAARIEAALNGTLSDQTERKNKKRRRSESKESKRKKSKLKEKTANKKEKKKKKRKI